MRKNSKLKSIHIHEADTEGSWMISYGDMITLLLSFFVIFFSFDFNKEKEDVLDQKLLQNINFTIEEQASREDSSETTTYVDDLNTISTVTYEQNNGNKGIFFKSASFFNVGGIDVNEQGLKVLKLFYEKFLPYAGKFKVKIQAFTDSSPVRNPAARYRDNVELSALRSISVMRYLKELGLPLSRIEIGGKGIMSTKTLNILGLNNLSKGEREALSRTVAITLSREDI